MIYDLSWHEGNQWGVLGGSGAFASGVDWGAEDARGQQSSRMEGEGNGRYLEKYNRVPGALALYVVGKADTPSDRVDESQFDSMMGDRLNYVPHSTSYVAGHRLDHHRITTDNSRDLDYVLRLGSPLSGLQEKVMGPGVSPHCVWSQTVESILSLFSPDLICAFGLLLESDSASKDTTSML